MEIKIEITPSILEDIAGLLKKEAEHCYKKSNLDTDIVSCLKSTTGERVLLVWRPSYEEGKIRNL